MDRWDDFLISTITIKNGGNDKIFSSESDNSNQNKKYTNSYLKGRNEKNRIYSNRNHTYNNSTNSLQNNTSDRRFNMSRGIEFTPKDDYDHVPEQDDFDENSISNINMKYNSSPENYLTP